MRRIFLFDYNKVTLGKRLKTVAGLFIPLGKIENRIEPRLHLPAQLDLIIEHPSFRPIVQKCVHGRGKERNKADTLSVINKRARLSKNGFAGNPQDRSWSYACDKRSLVS